MIGLPSAPALRRASVAAVAGAGLALVGLSFSNIAALDGTLRAATEQAAPPAQQDTGVSFATQQVRDCPDDSSRSTPRASPAAQY